jgi:glycosyltransferase involved in cell wall biosynthesis
MMVTRFSLLFYTVRHLRQVQIYSRINFIAAWLTIVSRSPINFIFVGWLLEAKGIPQLLAAAKKLKDQYKFTLTLIGGGTLSELDKQKSEIDLADHLKVLVGRIKKQVQQHLVAVDVFYCYLTKIFQLRCLKQLPLAYRQFALMLAQYLTHFTTTLMAFFW